MNEKKFKSTLDSKFSKKNVRTKIPGTVEFLTLHLSNPPPPPPPTHNNPKKSVFI